MYSAYPSEDDLFDRINALGVATEPVHVLGIDLTAKINTAVSRFEYDTGHQPFLAGGSDTTRTLDPPEYGNRLWLPCGLCAFTSLTINGVARTLDTDFYLYEPDAAVRSRPYAAIEFVGSFISRRQRSIAITGRWGWSTTLPAGAREAILTQAMLQCQSELALAISRGLYSIRDEHMETRYGGGGVTPLMKEGEYWKQRYNESLREFRLYPW